MNVTFRIYLPDGERLTEEKIENNRVAVCQTIVRLEDMPGGIFIEDPSTGATTCLGDTLSVLISAFCLAGLIELKNKGKIHVNFFNHDEFVDIQIMDGRVFLSGDEITPQSYPAGEYLKFMVACAERYVELMRQAWKGHSGQKNKIKDLENSLAAAKQALI